MATPKKPGARVMLAERHGDVRHGEVGRVAARHSEDRTQETSWDVRLESGQVLEIKDQHLLCVAD